MAMEATKVVNRAFHAEVRVMPLCPRSAGGRTYRNRVFSSGADGFHRYHQSGTGPTGVAG